MTTLVERQLRGKLVATAITNSRVKTIRIFQGPNCLCPQEYRSSSLSRAICGVLHHLRCPAPSAARAVFCVPPLLWVSWQSYGECCLPVAPSHCFLRAPNDLRCPSPATPRSGYDVAAYSITRWATAARRTRPRLLRWRRSRLKRANTRRLP